MSDIRGETVWPIVDKNLVVLWIMEGNGGDVFERWWAPGKAVLEDVVGHASILAFNFVGPGHVTAQIRGLAFKGFEFISSYK